MMNKMYLAGNVSVRRVMADSEDNLFLDVIYADYEDQQLIFKQVLYTDVNRSVTGKRISVVVELPTDELKGNVDREVSEYISKHLLVQKEDSLERQLSMLQYHVYQVFLEKEGEYLVIAKGVEVQ